MAAEICSRRKICWKVCLTVVVPAPEPPPAVARTPWQSVETQRRAPVILPGERLRRLAAVLGDPPTDVAPAAPPAPDSPVALPEVDAAPPPPTDEPRSAAVAPPPSPAGAEAPESEARIGGRLQDGYSMRVPMLFMDASAFSKRRKTDAFRYCQVVKTIRMRPTGRTL